MLKGKAPGTYEVVLQLSAVGFTRNGGRLAPEDGATVFCQDRNDEKPRMLGFVTGYRAGNLLVDDRVTVVASKSALTIDPDGER